MKDFFQKYIKYIITALSFVVALAWRDAFKTFFQSNKYLNRFGPWAYAVIITGLVLLTIFLLEKANTGLDELDLEQLFKKLNNRDSVDRDSVDRDSVDHDSVDNTYDK